MTTSRQNIMLKDKIKGYRKANKLTQKELADKLNISRGYLSDIESGKSNGTIEIVKKLSDISGLKINYWLEDDSSLENEYVPYSSLDLLIDAYVKENKIDPSNGNMDKESEIGIMNILRAEIVLKYKNRK